jgi:small subunit ribosomal protein S17
MQRCPFHGKLKVHGAIIVGKVISSKASKTVTVSYVHNEFIPKYERYEKKYTKVKAHNPECINAKENDTVKIMETRPLSKTKNFVVIEKINQ